MAQPVRAPILIVEDNADTREILERVLLISGYDVVATRDGVEALGYLRGGGQPAAIILDVAMPRMDGVAFRRALTADDRFDDIPIVVYTANPHRVVPNVFGTFRKGTDDPGRLLEMIASATRAAAQ
jgi:two-component system response regulator MprA